MRRVSRGRSPEARPSERERVLSYVKAMGDGAVLVIDCHNLRAGGGITHITSLLRNAGLARGFAVIHVLAGRYLSGRLRGLAAKVRVHHEPLLDGRLAARTWWRMVILPRRLVQLGADVAFCPTGLVPPHWPRRTRVVVMCRNMLPFDDRERARYGVSGRRLRLEILRVSQLRAFERADGVIFLSQHAERSIVAQARIPPRRRTIIPHGVGEAFGQSSAIEVQQDLVVYVSTIDLYKHQWNVVEAIATLRKKGRDVRLQLIGPSYPPAMRRLERAIARFRADAFVEVAGPREYLSLPAAMAQAHVLVFASTCENCPNTLLECMACGRPVACSSSPPMPEFAESTVTYFDAEDPVSIASALGILLDTKAATGGGEGEASSRAAKFTWRRCAEQTFEYLLSVGREREDASLPSALVTR